MEGEKSGAQGGFNHKPRKDAEKSRARGWG